MPSADGHAGTPELRHRAAAHRTGILRGVALHNDMSVTFYKVKKSVTQGPTQSIHFLWL